jgi:hypothetical protein
VVNKDDYQVFLTPMGESKGWLYVSGKTASGFSVHEAGGGASSIAFDYRVVAKRKDVTGARLEYVDEPPEVQLLKLPELPVTTVPPRTPPRQAAAASYPLLRSCSRHEFVAAGHSALWVQCDHRFASLFIAHRATLFITWICATMPL